MGHIPDSVVSEEVGNCRGFELITPCWNCEIDGLQNVQLVEIEHLVFYLLPEKDG